jgi:hypothetical protein
MMVKRKPKPKKKLMVQYLGETDPAQFIWSNRTHRSASEAFRDADYATAFYRPKSEWEDCKEFVSGMVLMMPVILFTGYVCYLILIAKGY